MPSSILPIFASVYTAPHFCKNGAILSAQYQKYGASKLAIMATFKNGLEGKLQPTVTVKDLDKLKKFKGVISPDFSLYRNMPLVMQMWNTYRGRAVACWLQNNGVEIIPNVRFGDERTFSFCFDGVEENKTVAVGTHGCIKRKEDKIFFKNAKNILGI